MYYRLFSFSKFFLLSLIVYLLGHIVTGSRGAVNGLCVLQNYHEKKSHLHALAHERTILERKIEIMGEALDPDLLEEQVRAVLGYVHRDDIIISCE